VIGLAFALDPHLYENPKAGNQEQNEQKLRKPLPKCGDAFNCSMMQDLANAYFPEEYADDMICIAYYESSWCAEAYNGECCYGLWQINSVHIGDSGCPAESTYDLLNPDTNAACAVEVLNSQGLNAWTTWAEGDCNGWNQC